MAFDTKRVSTLPRGGTNQRRPGAPAPQAERAAPMERIKAIWTSTANLYDPWHSTLEPQVVADFYKTSLALKMSPVYAERRGLDEDTTHAGSKKYNREDTTIMVLDLVELVTFRHQLLAFLNSQLQEVVLERPASGKRLVLCNADTLFETDHPEYELHATGKVIMIETDPDGKTNGGNIVFVSRPKEVILSDDTSVPVEIIYPELQCLLTIIDSVLTNCARVDFAASRLLGNMTSSAAEDKPTGGSATMPVRRSGGLAAPVSRPGPTSTDDADNPATGRTAATSTLRRTTVTSTVDDSDLDAALGDSSAPLNDADLSAALGDNPSF